MKQLDSSEEEDPNKEDSDHMSNDEEDNDEDRLTDDEEEYEDESCMLFENEAKLLLPVRGEEFLIKEFSGTQEDLNE